MKKTKVIVGALAFAIISFSLILCACQPQHEHVYNIYYDDSGHWQGCYCSDDRVDFNEHAFGEPYNVNQSTCTYEGNYEHDCVDCGYSTVVYTPIVGHDLETVEAKEATCSEMGYYEYERCKSCNYNTKQEYYDYDNHNMLLSEEYGTEPTCQSEGEAIYVCSWCSTRKSEVLPTTECKYEYFYSATAHWQQCKWCEGGKTEELPHDYSVENDCSVCSYNHPNSSDLTYTLSDDGTYYILSGFRFTSYASHRTAFVPRYHEGLPVKEMTATAFAGDDAVYGVVLNDFIEEIPAKSFYSCDYLYSVKLGANVKRICNQAFDSTQELKSIHIPDSVEHIGADAFDVALVKVTGMKGIKTLGLRAFGTNYMEQFEIGNKIEFIDQDAIRYSDKLEYAQYGGCYYIGNESYPYSVLVKVADTKQDEYVIHEDTRVIFGTFENCNNITEFNMPDSVISTTDCLLKYCNNLEKVTISKNLQGSFYGFPHCAKVQSVDVPEGITRIEYGAFAFCSALENVTLRKGLKELDGEAFMYCTSLTQITIPHGVTRLGQWLFWGCKNLSTVSVPDTIEVVGEEAFRECNRLRYNTKDFSHYIGNSTNKYVILMATEQEVGKIEQGQAQQKIHDGARIVYDYAFAENPYLTEIDFPSSVVMVANRAFYACPNLEKVTLGSGIKYLGMLAFSSCEKLTSVQNDSALEEVGSAAFSKCSSLTEFEFKDATTVVYSEVFKDCVSLKRVTLPGGDSDLSSTVFEGCESLTEIYVYDSLKRLSKQVVSPTGIGEVEYNQHENGLYLGNESNPYVALIEVVDKSVKGFTFHDNIKIAVDGLLSGCAQIEYIIVPKGMRNLMDLGIRYELNVFTYEEKYQPEWGELDYCNVYFAGEWEMLNGTPVVSDKAE